MAAGAREHPEELTCANIQPLGGLGRQSQEAFGSGYRKIPPLTPRAECPDAQGPPEVLRCLIPVIRPL